MSCNASKCFRVQVRQVVVCLCLGVLFSGGAWAQSQNLDYFINYALSNSPLLKDYQNQISSTSIDSQKLRASFKPQVTGISQNMAAPVIGGFGYDPVLTNYGSYTTMVNANLAFVGKKNLATQYNALNLVGDSLKNARQLAEQDIKRTITAQYITTFGDMQQYNFNVTVNTLLKKQEVIFKRLAESNVYRQTDYLTFLVTLKQQDLQLKQLAIQFQTDYATLKYMCGIYDTTTSLLDSPAISLQQLPDESSSVFFLHYRTDSLSLQNSLAILNYNYKPKLSAFANAGFSSSFLYQAYQNFGYSFGFNVSVSIYDGHLKSLQTQKINLLENTRSNYRDFFKSQYYQQIYMLRKQLASTEGLIADINDQVRYAKGLIDVNGKLMETGDVKVSDFVIAINNYLAAKNLLTQNTISRLQIINQLNYWNR